MAGGEEGEARAPPPPPPPPAAPANGDADALLDAYAACLMAVVQLARDEAMGTGAGAEEAAAFVHQIEGLLNTQGCATRRHA